LVLATMKSPMGCTFGMRIFMGKKKITDSWICQRTDVLLQLELSQEVPHVFESAVMP
jgi:hypothetical protein